MKPLIVIAAIIGAFVLLKSRRVERPTGLTFKGVDIDEMAQTGLYLGPFNQSGMPDAAGTWFKRSNGEIYNSQGSQVEVFITTLPPADVLRM